MPTFPMPTFTINYRGKADIDGVMALVYEWLNSRKFYYTERKYKHRPDEKEIRIESELKITDYVRYFIEVEVRAMYLKPVDVEKDGKKSPGYEGNISIDVTGRWEADWQKRWGGSKFLQNLDFFFRKYIMHQDLEHWYEDNLLAMLNSLKAEIQRFIGLEVFH